MSPVSLSYILCHDELKALLSHSASPLSRALGEEELKIIFHVIHVVELYLCIASSGGIKMLLSLC